MTDPHAARAHATWSASSTERNWNCPGALALTIDLPETTSQAADWGTCAHEIAEHCLFDPNKQADSFIGQTIKGKSYSFEVDEEMAETAQMYVDYCRKRMADYKAETGDNPLVFVEERFSLESLNPPFDAGGISDCTMIFRRWKTIESVDLKGGRGHVVEAIGNPQARTYSLGALLKHPGHDIEKVMSTIVQPRAPHKDGRIRSDVFHVADLVEWTTDLVAAMRRASNAMIDQPTYPPAEWAKMYLAAGDHCKFCKAKATCPAIEQKVIDTVGVWFEETGEPRLANTPPDTDPAARGHKLDMLDMIEGWIAAFREEEHRKAEAGDPAANYGLVARQGREKWNDGVEEQVIGAAVLAKLPESKYLNPGKLKTPKQIRKELGKQADLVAGLSTTPDAGTNLVRLDKTTRAPVQSTAERFFEPNSN
jgi:hypothetical protein